MFMLMARQSSKADLPLGNALLKLRAASGRTQEKVAAEAGITTGTLARIELGQSSPEWWTIRQILNALDISLVELAEVVETAERG
jgi:transcriptional regulator with XRE-family HTH domain